MRDYYSYMNKVVSMAEGGPISDFAVSDSSEKDLVLLSLGFRLITEWDDIRLWSCRMCNGDKVVDDVFLISAISHGDAVAEIKKTVINVTDDYRFLEILQNIWLIFKLFDLSTAPVNANTGISVVFTIEIVKSPEEVAVYTNEASSGYIVRGEIVHKEKKRRRPKIASYLVVKKHNYMKPTVEVIDRKWEVTRSQFTINPDRYNNRDIFKKQAFFATYGPECPSIMAVQALMKSKHGSIVDKLVTGVHQVWLWQYQIDNHV
jgi:hypothetical protein